MSKKPGNLSHEAKAAARAASSGFTKTKHESRMATNVWSGFQSVEELQEMARSLSKVANQRMVRLEREEGLTGGGYKEIGFYKESQTYLEYQVKKAGKKEKDTYRFPESYKSVTDVRELKQDITRLQGLLSYKSSTVGGWHEIENSRQETFAKKGISEHITSTKSFYKFLNSPQYAKLKKAGYDSDQIIDLISDASSNGKSITAIVKGFNDFEKATRTSEMDEKRLREYIGASKL